MTQKPSGKILNARQLMVEVRARFKPETELMQAIEKLAELRLSAAVVVDDGGSLVGILTEKDCLRALSMAAFHRPWGGLVSDFMSPLEHVLKPDMDLFRIAEIFLANNFPMLPVVDGGRVIGCITRQSMLRGIMALTRAKEVELERIEEDARQAVSRPSSIADMQKMFARYSKEQLVRRLGRKS